MVSAIDEIPAALLKTLDSVSVRNIVAALLIPLPHGMTAPRAEKRAKKNRGCAPVLGKRITQLLEDVADDGLGVVFAEGYRAVSIVGLAVAGVSDIVEIDGVFVAHVEANEAAD